MTIPAQIPQRPDHSHLGETYQNIALALITAAGVTTGIVVLRLVSVLYLDWRSDQFFAFIVEMFAESDFALFFLFAIMVPLCIFVYFRIQDFFDLHVHGFFARSPIALSIGFFGALLNLLLLFIVLIVLAVLLFVLLLWADYQSSR